MSISSKACEIVGDATGDRWLLMLLPTETKLGDQLGDQTFIPPYSTDNRSKCYDIIAFLGSTRDGNFLMRSNRVFPKTDFSRE